MSSNKKGQHGGSRAGAGRKPTKLVTETQTNIDGDIAIPTNKGTGANTVFDMNKRRKDEAARKEDAARVAARKKEHDEMRRKEARDRVDRLRKASDAAVAELQKATRITGPNAGSAAPGPAVEGEDEEEGYLSDDEEYDDNGLTSGGTGAKYKPPHSRILVNT